MTEKKKFKVMFLCTANSCRSQMAEGFARHFGKEIIEPYSAGLFVFYVHSRAIAIMKEIDIDISKQRSEVMNVDQLKGMDMIITLCGNAETACPVPPAEVKRIHWPIKDPVGTVGTEEEIMSAFRKARDEIKSRVQCLIEELKKTI
jgi:arsenate reductase